MIRKLLTDDIAHTSTELSDSESRIETFMIFDSPEARAISGRCASL